MKNKIILNLSIIAIVISLIIGFTVRASEEGILFDETVMEYVHSRTTPIGIKVMKIITYFGSLYFFLPIGILIFVFTIKNKNVSRMILLILSTLGSYGLNFLLKNIFVRLRPLKYFLIEQGGYSFPSGHSMVSISFYTTMTYLLLKNENNKWVKRTLWIINFMVVAIIGFSRIYLGVHWPTDVLTGYLIGLIFTYTSIKLVEKNE